ncbi:DNA repair protein RecO [Bacteroidota bacterium]
MIVKTEGIVLNSRKHGETSKIISLFTKDYGKISVIAKGARKSKNKFGSSLDPLSYCSIVVYMKSGRNLHLLSNSELYIPLRRIYNSFNHLTAGLVIVEAISQTQDIKEVSNEIFRLATESLIKLNELNKNPLSVSTCFLIKLTGILGFAIDFVSIREKINDKTEKHVYFSLKDGSVVKNNIRNNVYRFDLNVAGILWKLSISGLSKSSEINMENKVINQIHDFFISYFSFHFEKRFSFRTLNLFKTML